MKHSKRAFFGFHLSAEGERDTARTDRRQGGSSCRGLLWITETGMTHAANVVAQDVGMGVLTVVTESKLPLNANAELGYVDTSGRVAMVRGCIREMRNGMRISDMLPTVFVSRLEMASPRGMGDQSTLSLSLDRMRS